MRQQAKAFPGLKPVRPAGFTLSADGKGILIAGWEANVVMVILGKDLQSLQMIIPKQKGKVVYSL